MKKLVFILTIIFVTATAWAGGQNYFDFAFIGRWQSTEDPLLIDDNGFQDIQNLRKDGKRLKGVSGHTAINTAVPNSAKDTSDFTETDTAGRITLTDSTTVTVADLDTDEDAFLYYDHGADYFAGNFEFTLKLNMSAMSANDRVGIWGLTNTVDSYYDIDTASGDFLVLDAGYVVITEGIRLIECNNGVLTQDSAVISPSTDYYLKVKRDESVGTYGTLYCYIYSDSAMTTLVDTLTVTLTENQDFRYLFWLISYNDGGAGGDDWDGVVSDLASVYSDCKTGYHFKEDNPAETHVIIQATDDTGDYSLFENTTAIPSSGNFTSTAIYSEETGASIARFDTASKGDLLICDSKESLVWSGSEKLITSLVTSTSSAMANARDETDAAQNNLQTSGNFITIGNNVDSSMKLLLQMEDTAGSNIVDQSDSAHGNATKNGTANLTNDYAKFGIGSVFFDGNSDSISYVDSADWFMDTSDFTVDFWVKHISLPSGGGTQQYFAQYVDATHYVYCNLLESSGFYFLQFIINDAGSTFTAQRIVPLDTLDWHHIAVVRNSNVLDLYCDGNDWGNTWAITDDWPDLAAAFEIGSYNTASGNYFHGYIDEFRVSKGVARWSDDFTPPDSPYQAARAYAYVGTTRPIKGLKFYVLNPNVTASTLAISEWVDGSWNDLTVTDNTDTGPALGQTGTATFTSTVTTSRPRFLNGEYLFWYRCYLDSGSADVYQITVDAPVQSIVDLWDGKNIQPHQFKVYDNSLFEDYTQEVIEEGSIEYVTNPVAAELDDLLAAEYVYVGFPVRVSAIKWDMLTGHINVNAATVSVYFWNGNAWASVGTVTDQTTVGGASLAQSDWMYWDQPGTGEEYPQALFGVPGYFYKIVWSAALSADVLVDMVYGGGGVDTLDGFGFPLKFQGRSFLCNETGNENNTCIYSGFDNTDSWNGSDSGRLSFGDATGLKAGCVLYNVYLNNGLEQAIICKQNETYRVFGNGPENWDVDKVDGNIGCVAPLSMLACGVTDSSGSKRNVAIWQAAHGVVLCDGTNIFTISDDIKNYWDPNDSTYIPAGRQDDSVAWYNPNLETYTLLVSSGSGQATHNVELEYSLKYKEWTKLYREDSNGARPLQCGFQTHDTVGNVYIYGASNNGYVYHLENGNNWDGTAIAQYVQTKNLLFDPQLPLWRKTAVEYLRLSFEDKTTNNGEVISIAHYCDDTLTVNGTDSQDIWDNVDMDEGPYDTQDVTLGECLMHSFKVSTSTSAIADGMELTGLGVVFDTYDTIAE